MGTSVKVRKDVISDIFGKHRLVSCNDLKKFELKVIKLSEKYSKSLPSFTEYFANIVEKIRSGVFNARQNNKLIPIDWKNNLCKLMNHIMNLLT